MNILTNIHGSVKITDLSEGAIYTLQQSLTLLGYKIDDDQGLAGRETTAAWARWKAKNFLGEPSLIGPSSVKMLLDQLQEKKQAEARFTEIDWTDFSCHISQYFTVGEVCLYDQRRIPQKEEIKKNAIILAKQLDILRTDWGKPIIITSWYRPPSVNQAVGGARNSQHLTGRAADVRSDPIMDFQAWLDRKWDKALGYGARKGFVHLDLRPGRLRWNY